MVLELSGDDVERIVTNRLRRFLLPVVMMILPIAISGAALLTGWDISFSITARTEVITIDAVESALPDWALSDARLEVYAINPAEDDGLVPSVRKVSGVLTVSRDAYVRVEYPGREFIYIYVSQTNPDSDRALATFRDNQTGKSEFILDDFSIELSVNSASSKVLLPISGVVTVGDIVHLQGASDQFVLQDGAVEGLAEEVVSDGRFIAVESSVAPGDVITLWQSDGKPAPGMGFLEIRQGNSMLVQFLGNAAWAKVDRLGSDGYQIKPSVWDRVSKDQFFQASALIYSALVPMLLSLLIYWSRSGVASRMKEPEKPLSAPSGSSETETTKVGAGADEA